MFKKMILIFIALFLIAGIALGASAVLAQETEDATVPNGYGPGHMWQWQRDGEEAAVPYGHGHMWQWQQDGEAPPMPYGYGPGMMGGWMMDGNSLLDITAEALDLTVDEVWAALSEGISIAELAESHGVDVQVIIDAFSQAHATALQEAVEAGWLTQEQADWMQQNMAAMIAERVNQPWSGGFGPGAGPGGCRGYDNGEAPGSGFGPRGRGGMRGGWGGMHGWQQGPNA